MMFRDDIDLQKNRVLLILSFCHRKNDAFTGLGEGIANNYIARAINTR